MNMHLCHIIHAHIPTARERVRSHKAPTQVIRAALASPTCRAFTCRGTFASPPSSSHSTAPQVCSLDTWCQCYSIFFFFSLFLSGSSSPSRYVGAVNSFFFFFFEPQVLLPCWQRLRLIGKEDVNVVFFYRKKGYWVTIALCVFLLFCCLATRLDSNPMIGDLIPL